MLSEWNKFVSKVYKEGKSKNANYKFKDALRDASRRKGEMGKGSLGKSAKGNKSKKMRGGQSIVQGLMDASPLNPAPFIKNMTRGGRRRRKSRSGRSRKHRGGCSNKHPLMPADYPADGNAP
jgi:hypothetical protein